jgi:hypothetical protein
VAGVRPRCAAAWEFILFDAKTLYEAKLQETRLEQGIGISSVSDAHTSEMPTERACKAVLQEMKTRSVDLASARATLVFDGDCAICCYRPIPRCRSGVPCDPFKIFERAI